MVVAVVWDVTRCILFKELHWSLSASRLFFGGEGRGFSTGLMCRTFFSMMGLQTAVYVMGVAFAASRTQETNKNNKVVKQDRRGWLRVIGGSGGEEKRRKKTSLSSESETLTSHREAPQKLQKRSTFRFLPRKLVFFLVLYFYLYLWKHILAEMHHPTIAFDDGYDEKTRRGRCSPDVSCCRYVDIKELCIVVFFSKKKGTTRSTLAPPPRLRGPLALRRGTGLRLPPLRVGAGRRRVHRVGPRVRRAGRVDPGVRARRQAPLQLPDHVCGERRVRRRGHLLGGFPEGHRLEGLTLGRGARDHVRLVQAVEAAQRHGFQRLEDVVAVLLQRLVERLVDVDARGTRRVLELRRERHGVAEHVVLHLHRAEDAGHQRPLRDADAQVHGAALQHLLQALRHVEGVDAVVDLVGLHHRTERKVDNLLHLRVLAHLRDAHLLALVGCPARLVLDAAGAHVAVADDLDHLEPEVLRQRVQACEDQVAELHDLPGVQLPRELREAHDVGKQRRRRRVAVGDVAGDAETLRDLRGQRGVEHLLALRHQRGLHDHRPEGGEDGLQDAPRADGEAAVRQAKHADRLVAEDDGHEEHVRDVHVAAREADLLRAVLRVERLPVADDVEHHLRVLQLGCVQAALALDRLEGVAEDVVQEDELVERLYVRRRTAFVRRRRRQPRRRARARRPQVRRADGSRRHVERQVVRRRRAVALRGAVVDAEVRGRVRDADQAVALEEVLEEVGDALQDALPEVRRGVLVVLGARGEVALHFVEDLVQVEDDLVAHVALVRQLLLRLLVPHRLDRNVQQRVDVRRPHLGQYLLQQARVAAVDEGVRQRRVRRADARGQVRYLDVVRHVGLPAVVVVEQHQRDRRRLDDHRADQKLAQRLADTLVVADAQDLVERGDLRRGVDATGFLNDHVAEQRQVLQLRLQRLHGHPRLVQRAVAARRQHDRGLGHGTRRARVLGEVGAGRADGPRLPKGLQHLVHAHVGVRRADEVVVRHVEQEEAGAAQPRLGERVEHVVRGVAQHGVDGGRVDVAVLDDGEALLDLLLLPLVLLRDQLRHLQAVDDAVLLDQLPLQVVHLLAQALGAHVLHGVRHAVRGRHRRLGGVVRRQRGQRGVAGALASRRLVVRNLTISRRLAGA
eukprot:Rhum_TRINITY_DN14740_c5_g2::Rhum_TRINITY_DN14740_c5_g2_i1::g.114457::m.114457